MVSTCLGQGPHRKTMKTVHVFYLKQSYDKETMNVLTHVKFFQQRLFKFQSIARTNKNK